MVTDDQRGKQPEAATERSGEADRVTAYAKVLLDEGAGPGNSIHSWRCEYPEQYGACDCVREVASELVALADQEQKALLQDRAQAIAERDAAQAEVERMRANYLLAADAQRLNDRFAKARKANGELRAALAAERDKVAEWTRVADQVQDARRECERALIDANDTLAQVTALVEEWRQAADHGEDEHEPYGRIIARTLRGCADDLWGALSEHADSRASGLDAKGASPQGPTGERA